VIRVLPSTLTGRLALILLGGLLAAQLLGAAILLSDRIVPMIPGPPATLGAPIPVELPRPRTLALLAHDEQATHVRAHVVSTLAAAIARPKRSSGPPATSTSTVLSAAAEEVR